jgi:hypothetical protein
MHAIYSLPRHILAPPPPQLLPPPLLLLLLCCAAHQGLPLPLLSFVTVRFSTVTVQVLHSSAAPSLKFRSSTVAVPCCPVMVMFLQEAYEQHNIDSCTVAVWTCCTVAVPCWLCS